MTSYFYPRSPCGERRIYGRRTCKGRLFLSTLSLRRATAQIFDRISITIFLSTLSLRRATPGPRLCPLPGQFLSTLSLRRATFALWMALNLPLFLSTLSLRHVNATDFHLFRISIHALLAESDHGHGLQKQVLAISIHALLAESDARRICQAGNQSPFLSTLSLRRATSTEDFDSSTTHFYPRSPCGERRYNNNNYVVTRGFLSTLSLRRATHIRQPAVD